MEIINENTTTEKTDFYQRIFSSNGMEEKRKLLKELSQKAKLMMEFDPEVGERVNDVILNKMYRGSEHFVFKTFKAWKEEGFSVIPGSKAFFIWSRPRKVKKKKEEGEAEDEFKMFGIAHLFSNAQVRKLEE